MATDMVSSRRFFLLSAEVPKAPSAWLSGIGTCRPDGTFMLDVGGG